MKRIGQGTAKRLLRYAAAPLFIPLTLLLIVACAGGKSALQREDGSPLSIVEYEKIAQKEREINRYENAIKAYEAIVRYYGDNTNAVVWATYETGFCYFKLGRYADAEGYFQKIIDEFQDPAAKKLSRDMLSRIVDKANKKKKR